MTESGNLNITARTIAEEPHETEAHRDQCPIEGKLDPCIIVIFGATGDLTTRKLFPSLYALLASDILTDSIIIGAARSDLDHASFRQLMKESLVNSGTGLDRWDKFESSLYYHRIDYSKAASYRELSALMNSCDEGRVTSGNRLFYLSVPPGIYEPIIENLGLAGFGREESRESGWSRLVIEKPFGRDTASARGLNLLVNRYFSEKQVFRIDHYLAKETAQNILMLRFANAIFEPVWNRNYIDSIFIDAEEDLGVGHRGAFYEETGVLRDIFQNHMLQILSLVTMEPPALFEAERVRDERTKVLRCLKPFPTDQLGENLVLGQYSAGVIKGQKVSGYTGEPGVNPSSSIPTYARMRVYIENWRWQGVPMILTAGKRLGAKKTAVTIHFKEVPASLFRNLLGEHVTANTLTLGIYPEETVELTFQAKTPGARVCLRSVTMNFNYNQGFETRVFDAYEKVLIDCILGDQTLFLRQDAVEQGWQFLTPILEVCDHLSCPMLHHYEAGSSGPVSADFLLEGTRRDSCR